MGCSCGLRDATAPRFASLFDGLRHKPGNNHFYRRFGMRDFADHGGDSIHVPKINTTVVGKDTEHIKTHRFWYFSSFIRRIFREILAVFHWRGTGWFAGGGREWAWVLLRGFLNRKKDWFGGVEGSFC